jgi:tetratricopeptide (TPR) repeat protein
LEDVKKIRNANNNIASGRETVFSVAELYQLAQVYIKMNNYNKALQYFEKIITVLSYDNELLYGKEFRFLKPTTKAKFHLEIAEIYINIGDKENAVKEAKKAAELDPVNFAEKARKIID